MNSKLILSKLKTVKNSNYFKVISISFIISIAASLLLQFFQLSQNIYAVMDWVASNFEIFLLSSLFIFFLNLFLTSVIGNLYISSIATFFLFGAVGFSNSKKISVLGEPLYPADFYQVRNVKSLFEMIGGHISFSIVIFLIFICFLLVFLYKKLPKLKVNLRLRFSTLLLSTFIIYSYLHFSGTFMNVISAKAGVDIVLWNQPENYASNGFVFGLLSNLQNDVMEEPEGYSEEKISEIVEKYTLQADKLNKSRNTKAISTNPNIIYIMNETFWDPTRLETLKFSEDPLKNLQDIMANSPSGLLLSPAFGGNTANVEFEALTGLSMYNLIPGSIPYQQSIREQSSFPSIVSILEEKDYDTIAIHPYKKVFYKRDEVYKSLGFNSFLGEEDMTYSSRLTDDSYISDQAVVNEILDKLKEKDSPVFVHAVTMQNHLPIQAGKNGVNSISIDGLSPESKEELETYTEGIKQSALAAKNLTEALSKLNEPTVVVFFGDHLPSFSNTIYEDAGFYKYSPSENERIKSETPLFIYSNFTIDKTQLHTLSPAFLGVTLFDLLEQPITPYYAMLKDVKSHIPGLKHDVLIDSNSNVVASLSEDDENLLQDYKLIQYDLLRGKQYSLPSLFNIP